MKVLVLGSDGQLGRCLNDQLSKTEYDVTFASRGQIDIAEREELIQKLAALSPDIIINAAAYTAVDLAEAESELAEIINHKAVANLSAICRELDCGLIHVSTDYVFDGESRFAYKESDQTAPQGVYGKTKLKGELAIQSSGCHYIILRTAWVFSEYGNNFLKTMLRLGGQRDELSIVCDQIGCPTYAQDIAKAISLLVGRLEANEFKSGVYHFCGDQPCSWYELAVVIFEEAKTLGMRTPQKIHAITSESYPTPAFRPAFSALNCAKIGSEFGIVPSDWRSGVKMALRAQSDRT